MALYREQGVVLRTWKLGEADRIINVLTPGRGKVRAVAKGVRKTTSRIGGRLEPYSHVDLQLYEGRNLDVVTQAELITSFSVVRGDFDVSACAAGVMEAADRIAQEDEQSNRVFLLVLDALRQLATLTSATVPVAPQVILDAFVLRLASMAGYHAVVSECAACGRSYDPRGSTGRSVGFHIAAGGLLCSGCRPPDSQQVRPEVISLLGGLSFDPDWGQATNEAADARDRRVAQALARSFYTYHVGRPLRAWEVVSK